MQELEKILEEIDKYAREFLEDNAFDPGYRAGAARAAREIKAIIRKNMDNDGWIPVQERIPEDSLESVIGWDAYRERCCFVQCRNGRFYLSSGELVKIVAWQPLPEPYRE